MEDKASRTAVGVLAARALYTAAPAEQQIINDPLAVDFLPPSLTWLKSWLKLTKTVSPAFFVGNLMSKTMGPGGASLIALRHRYIDDALKTAVRDGINQVVLLGAGFDSRAYRMNLGDVNFVEIDHPRTQANKIKALKAMNVNSNKSVQLLPVDFQTDWIGQIQSAGIIRQVPTYFIMEGVSYYLTEEALLHTLNSLKKIAAPGSKIMFDCFPEEIMNKQSRDQIVRRFRRNVDALGEPFTWGIDQVDVGAFLDKLGYTMLDNKNMQEVADILRSNHNMEIETLPAHEYMYLVEATIPS